MTKIDIKRKLIEIIEQYYSQTYPGNSLPTLSSSQDSLIDLLAIDSLMSVELTMDILDGFGIDDEKLQSIFVGDSKLKYPNYLNVDQVVERISAYLN